MEGTVTFTVMTFGRLTFFKFFNGNLRYLSIELGTKGTNLSVISTKTYLDFLAMKLYLLETYASK